MAFRLARDDEAPSLWSRTIDRPGGRFLAGAIAALFLLALLASDRAMALAARCAAGLIEPGPDIGVAAPDPMAALDSSPASARPWCQIGPRNARLISDSRRREGWSTVRRG